MSTAAKKNDLSHQNEQDSECLITVECVTKTFLLYRNPFDRLKQFVASWFTGITKKQYKKYFDTFDALSGVSFIVKRGQSVGIIGRNGSGKSTLLQLIAGTLNPTSGAIAIDGKVAALLELGSGFNPEFTGRENVYMNARIYGLDDAQISRRYDEIAAFADIGEFIDQPIKTYSSGMALRLAFAVIAHVDADILIIDEALAVGDVFFIQKCMRFLNRFMKTGTLLLVSHDTSAIQALCDHVIWLDGGKVLEAGSPKDVTEHYLEAMFSAKQGEHSTVTVKKDCSQKTTMLDQRQDIINNSNLKNDIQVFQFDPAASSFGKINAQVIDVRLCKNDGSQLFWCVGGEEVLLIINGHSLGNLQSLIIGFYVKDYLGQTLFGDNTFLSYRTNPLHVEKGETFSAQFVFHMPRLPKGDYTVSAAIATGTQDDHILQHWIHDAIAFQSASSSVSSGLIGIPMHKIELIKKNHHNA